MGGELDVKSEEGRGSTFAFSANFTIGNDIPEESAVVTDDDPMKDVKSKDVAAEKAETPVQKKPVTEKPVADVESIERHLELDALLPFINVRRGLENLKNNDKLYAVLLRSYQKNDLLTKIKEAISADSFKEAIHNAQALKSIAVSIGLDDLRTKMEMLEESLRSLVSDDLLMDKLKISREETKKLIPELITALEEGKLS